MKRRILYVGLVLAALAALAALLTPQGSAAVGKLWAHRLATVPLALLAIACVMAARRRRYGVMAVLGVLAAVVVSAYAASRIVAKYPDNILFTREGVSQGWRLLSGRDILVTEYEPRPTLRVANRDVERAKFPVIDAHFHLDPHETGVDADMIVRAMDSLGIERIVSVDGYPQQFERLAAEFRGKYPDRFSLFAVIDPWKITKAAFPDVQLEWMEAAATDGATGFKVFKALGLLIRDTSGTLVPIDDPRLAPLWEKAADLGLPVMMHLMDPTPFFDPIDRHNERYEELRALPEWSFHGDAFPSKAELLDQRENLLRNHPRTVFIGAHLGDNPEDLAYVARLLETYPNYFVEFSSRVSDLGRQPFTARRFFVRFQDRILFGTDGGASDYGTEWGWVRHYRAYFTFLETENEYMEYPLWGVQPQGRWRVYGISLPDSVLRKVYYENAARLILKR
jgi:predicted TIM-barrel fold metal-dependent hydrolase